MKYTNFRVWHWDVDPRKIRGMLATDLLNFDLCLTGPSWLGDPERLAVKLKSPRICSSLSENRGKEN